MATRLPLPNWPTQRVLSPFSGASRTPEGWSTHLSAQVDSLRAQGSTVATVFLDEESRAAFGDDVMNLATRHPAALASFAQGRIAAASLVDLWS